MLKTVNLTKRFGGLTAVDEVDLDIEKGEIAGLIGPNGAGKTTLINLITGRLPLDSGEVWWKGKEITNLKPNEICKEGISRTFQKGQFFPQKSVFKNVLAGALFGKDGVRKEIAKEKTNEVLEFIGLSDMKDMMPKDLPVGHRNLVGLARVLATEPELILLDEPFAGLTDEEISNLIECLKVMNETITIFVVGHVIRFIIEISDRLVVLNEGKKIAVGIPEEVIENDSVRKAYWG